MTNPLFDEFLTMMEEDEAQEEARAAEQIAFAMEGEDYSFSVLLLDALLTWMEDFLGDRESVKEVVKELL